MRKITSIFGRSREPRFGCGFLSQREIDMWVEGRLRADRVDRFRSHQAAGCMPCAHLAAAVDDFRDVMDNGVLEAERVQFERSRRVVEAVLRQEVERQSADGRTPMRLSSDELEQIAAAGDPHEIDPVNGGTQISKEPGSGGGSRDPRKGTLDPRLDDDAD